MPVAPGVELPGQCQQIVQCADGVERVAELGAGEAAGRDCVRRQTKGFTWPAVGDGQRQTAAAGIEAAPDSCTAQQRSPAPASSGTRASSFISAPAPPPAAGVVRGKFRRSRPPS